MNNFVTVYELLGLIKGDNAPKKVKVLDEIYEYDKYNKFYYNEEGYSLYRLFYEEGNALDIEVEILEEDKPIIEKINLDREPLKGKEVPRAIDYLLEGRINEIIDYINRKEDK